MTLALLALLMVLAAGALAPEMNQLRHFLWLRGYLDWLDARIAEEGHRRALAWTYREWCERILGWIADLDPTTRQETP